MNSQTFIIRSQSATSSATFSGKGIINYAYLDISRVNSGLLRIGDTVTVGGYTVTILSHGTTTATNSLGYFNISGINQYSYYFQGSLATDGWMTVTSSTPAVVEGMEIWINKTATPKPLMIAPFTKPNTIFTGSITNNVLIVTAIASGVLAQGQYVYNEKTNVILDNTRIISNFGETTSFIGDITGYVLTVSSGTVKVGMTLSGFGVFATVVLSQQTATSFTVNVAYATSTGVIALTGTYGANNAAGSHLLSTTQTAVSSQKLFLITNPTPYAVATGESGLYKLTTTPVSNAASTKLYVLQDINLQATNDLTFRLNGLPNRNLFRCEVVDFQVSALAGDVTKAIVELKVKDGLMFKDGRDNVGTSLRTIAIANLNNSSNNFVPNTHVFKCSNFNGSTVRFQLVDVAGNLFTYGTTNFARPWTLVLKVTPIDE